MEIINNKETLIKLFDDYHSKQLSFWVKSALQEKRKLGLFVGGAPLGYCYDTGNIKPKTLLVHPKESKVILRIFKLYSTGRYSYADIAEKINKTSIKTKNGNRFTHCSIKNILKNKTYLGCLPSKDKVLTKKGKHQTIISKILFDKVEKTMTERKSNAPISK